MTSSIDESLAGHFPLECSVEGCLRFRYCKTFCNMHYQRWFATGDVGKAEPYRIDTRQPRADTCTVLGCRGTHAARGYCAKHYSRWQRTGTTETVRREWGTGTIDCGYKRIWIDGKSHYEHRNVMERHIGRELFRKEHVHHINGDRLDNRIENLELWSTAHPPGQRIEDKIRWCEEFLSLYQDFRGHR